MYDIVVVFGAAAKKVRAHLDKDKKLDVSSLDDKGIARPVPRRSIEEGPICRSP